MITIIDEAKETIKTKKEKQDLETLCELLRAVEIWYNGNDVPVAEITKATHQFAQKIMGVMYMRMRPYMYEITIKHKTGYKDYFLDVLAEKIRAKSEW